MEENSATQHLAICRIFAEIFFLHSLNSKVARGRPKSKRILALVHLHF